MRNDRLKQTLRNLIRKRGFILLASRGHVRIKHPKGKVFTCSSSPGALNAHKELLRDIRRYEMGVYK